MPVKVPPSNIQAEQTILGICLLKPAVIPAVAAMLEPSDFYREGHQIIFEGICEIRDNLDLVSLVEWLKRKGDLERVGGENYLTSLFAGISTTMTCEYHSRLVKELSTKRRLIVLCSTVSEQCFSGADPVDVVSSLREGIQSVSRDAIINRYDNNVLFDQVYESIYQKDEPGLSAGIEPIDRHFYFEPGYIHCVAAESGVEKSAVLLQIADHIAEKYGRVLFYSLESTSQRLGYRLIARHSKVALTRINTRNFNSEHQEERILAAVNHLCVSNLILVDDTKYQEIEKLRIHAESMASKDIITAVFIDFLQIMSIKGVQQSRHVQISEIVKQFKYLAKDLNIPLIFASQLRKDISGRPGLDDLKESGDIRTHTDNILFLYAPSSYPVIYPVEIFLAKGKEQERFSEWLEFNGNYQEFKEGEKPA